MFYMLCISMRNKNVNPDIDSHTNIYSILTEVSSLLTRYSAPGKDSHTFLQYFN